MNHRPTAVIFLTVTILVGNASIAAEYGLLKISIRDAETGMITPARLHVKAADGSYPVAEDALLFGGDCDMSDAGAGYTTLEAALAGYTDRLHNYDTGATDFYTRGTSTVRVPPGLAHITVFKGPEYRAEDSEVDIAPGASVEHEVFLKRWVDMPASGWYSADDHLHIERPHPDLNPGILALMQAEDVHVANLLQMGKVRNFRIAPQYAFGPESIYQQKSYILAAGQENPRTHFLGHTITLGAPEPLFDEERYLIYRLIWEAAAKTGGINGFAHAQWPNALGTYQGMALLLPHNLMHFLEVLQFDRSGYDIWYDVLNLGFKVAPTAGTDYPCADQNIPGHERFYTRIDGELSYRKWIDAVRDGRTFVTTGPIVEFRIDGQDIGSEIELPEAGPVRIEGAVTFNPRRDDVQYIELVQNGSVVRRVSRVEGNSRIAFMISQQVDESSWFALRGFGMELNSSGITSVRPMRFANLSPTSNVHTAPIYVRLKGRPGIEKSERARQTATAWLARLKDLESVLNESNLEDLGTRIETPEGDALPIETLRSNRAALLVDIANAKTFFKALAQ